MAVAGPARWWRFERYALRGDHIWPVGRTRQKPKVYDPLAAYGKARSFARNERTAYQTLIDLLGDGTVDQLHANERIRKEVPRWCSEHGLLGILPHQAQMIILAPRWADEQDFYWSEVEEAFLWPVMRIYTQASGGWQTRLGHWKRSAAPLREIEPGLMLPTPPPRTSDARQVGQVVAPDRVPPNWPEPGVTQRRLADPHLEDVSLTDGVARFFPNVNESEHETFPYPQPLTPDFWTAYAEPLRDFLTAATMLRDALADLALFSGSSQPLSRSARQRRAKSFMSFNALLAPVVPIVSTDRSGRLIHRWSAPSLLAILALMALLDLDGGQRFLRCKLCDRWFVTRHPRATYCTKRCKFTANKRTQRRRKQVSLLKS